MFTIKVINYSKNIKIKKQYATPRSPSSEKTIELIEKRVDKLLDKVNVDYESGEDYGIAFILNNKEYYDYEDIMYKL